MPVYTSEALILRMRESECVRVELADDERVALLMEDYDFFVKDAELFCGRLDALAELRGKSVIDEWQAKVRAGDVVPVVRDLLVKHYDPGYASSIERNFKRYREAKPLVLADRSAAAMKRAARELAV